MAMMGDVARLAAMTTATVSNVANNEGIVGEATRRFVRAIIVKLGYHPRRTFCAISLVRTPTYEKKNPCISHDEHYDNVRRCAFPACLDGSGRWSVVVDGQLVGKPRR
jgi:hypothetical protein